jgi:hypothetical protein
VVVRLDEGSYWWRVRCQNESGWGSYAVVPNGVIVTEIIEPTSIIPESFVLSQNYPNPFNPTTIIKYGLPSQSKVKLEIYNTLGQRVVTLVDEQKEAGYFETEWNAINVATGLYFYRLEAVNLNNPANSFTQIKKMLLIK